MGENVVTVETAYLDAYNAIVRPEQIFSVSRYFLRYWLPVLTPATAWLIVELRQQSYRANGKPFQVDQESLARGAAVTERYVSQILNDDLKQFVDWSHQLRKHEYYKKRVFDKNRYVVFADEPLANIHAAGLMALFANDVDHVADTAQELVDADAETLLERIEIAASESPTATLSPAGWPGLLTVADVFAAATNRPARGNVAGLCSKLQRKIIAAPGGDVITTQYFRRRWLPLLGHALAWLVVVSRSHCFDDGKTVRDTFSIEKSTLAGEVGQHWNNVKNLLKREHATDFIRVDDDKSTRHTLTMTIRTWQTPGEVLTPDDRVRWQVMLNAPGGEPKICSDGKTAQPQICSEHVPQICSEHLNNQPPGFLNTPTTPPPGGGEGGGENVFTDDERKQALIEKLGIALADDFKSISALTPAVIESWREYMNRTGTGAGAVVKFYWNANPPVFTPPGSSSRPALPDLSPAADAPAPGTPGFSASGAAMLAARLARRGNGATPTN